MEDEFSELKYQNYQNEFLEDWWTRKKLFKGYRQSGKTTLILSELDRFLRYNMDCLVLVKSNMDQRRIFEQYEKRFGKKPNCTVRTFSGLRDGYTRGSNYDVVLIDDAQILEFDDIIRNIPPLRPMFIRATVSLNELEDDWEEEASEFFESVYIS